MTEKQKLQFEMLKKGEIFIWNIDDLTDEMKWWGCENDRTMTSIELTEEMLIYMVRNARTLFNVNQLKDVSIPEDAWIDGVRKSEERLAYFNAFLKIVIKYAIITSNLALEICLKVPEYYGNEEIRKHILEADNALEMKQNISNAIFSVIKEKSNRYNSFYQYLHPDLPVSEDMWQWMIDNNYFGGDVIEHFFITRDDAPVFVRHYLLSCWGENNHVYLNYFGEMSVEDLTFWADSHEQYFKMGNYYHDMWLSTVLEGVKCQDMSAVLRKHGWIIKYLKNPSQKLCKVAIDCSPDNIRYMKQNDKIALYALEKDKTVAKFLKKTKAICDYLGADYENPFSSEYYLVKFDEDVCDEGNLVKICVVKGKDMAEFLSRTTSLSFGNLDDDKERNVADIAEYQPITEEELAIIKKFGLDDIQSGYFANL